MFKCVPVCGFSIKVISNAYPSSVNNDDDFQWCSQNAEKVTHIKGRLLNQAMILFNCVPFQMGTSLKGKNSLRLDSFLYEQFLIVRKFTLSH